MVPFYFIEYGLAQLAALQIWRAGRGDEAGAVAAYRRALALGGTRPLPELYAAAGARLAFDAATMADLVGLIEEELDALDAQPAPASTTPLRRPAEKLLSDQKHSSRLRSLAKARSGARRSDAGHAFS
jgi:hypothetical protein